MLHSTHLLVPCFTRTEGGTSTGGIEPVFGSMPLAMRLRSAAGLTLGRIGSGTPGAVGQFSSPDEEEA